jgi:hypothetical protein
VTVSIKGGGREGGLDMCDCVCSAAVVCAAKAGRGGEAGKRMMSYIRCVVRYKPCAKFVF